MIDLNSGLPHDLGERVWKRTPRHRPAGGKTHTSRIDMGILRMRGRHNVAVACKDEHPHATNVREWKWPEIATALSGNRAKCVAVRSFGIVGERTVKTFS